MFASLNQILTCRVCWQTNKLQALPSWFWGTRSMFQVRIFVNPSCYLICYTSLSSDFFDHFHMIFMALHVIFTGTTEYCLFLTGQRPQALKSSCLWWDSQDKQQAAPLLRRILRVVVLLRCSCAQWRTRPDMAKVCSFFKVVRFVKFISNWTANCTPFSWLWLTCRFPLDLTVSLNRLNVCVFLLLLQFLFLVINLKLNHFASIDLICGSKLRVSFGVFAPVLITKTFVARTNGRHLVCDREGENSSCWLQRMQAEGLFFQDLLALIFKIDKDCLRIGKVTSSPFSDDGKMTVFYHAPCMFEAYVGDWLNLKTECNALVQRQRKSRTTVI